MFFLVKYRKTYSLKHLNYLINSKLIKLYNVVFIVGYTSFPSIFNSITPGFQ